nr:hypothetical protein [uncultured Bacteroides sp.]
MKIDQKYLQNRASKRKDNATINKSILEKRINPPNLYRFFCLSLYRNDYYNVRLRIKDIAKVTGEKVTALKNFNRDMETVLEKKRYYVKSNKPYVELSPRTIYKIPVKDYKGYITLSNQFTKVDLNVKTKGYYIMLLLIAENNVISLNSKGIADKLGMNKSTVAKYNLELYNTGLLRIFSNKLELTPHGLLLDNSASKQRIEWNKATGNPLPNIILKFEK